MWPSETEASIDLVCQFLKSKIFIEVVWEFWSLKSQLPKCCLDDRHHFNVKRLTMFTYLGLSSSEFAKTEHNSLRYIIGNVEVIISQCRLCFSIDALEIPQTCSQVVVSPVLV